MAWGGDRRSDKWKKKVAKKANPNKPRLIAETKLNTRAIAAPLPAEPKTADIPAIDPRMWSRMLSQLEEYTEQQKATSKPRSPDMNPFRLPEFPQPLMENIKKAGLTTMAMDNALVGNLAFSAGQWLNGSLWGFSSSAILIWPN